MNTQVAVRTAREFRNDITVLLNKDFLNKDGSTDHEHRDILADILTQSIICFLEDIENPTLPSVLALVEELPKLGWCTQEEAETALTTFYAVAA